MQYELTVITPGDHTTKQASAVTTAVEELITAQAGQLTRTKTWGRRTLAYPIGAQRYGYYSTFEFNGDGTGITALERALRLRGDVIRFLTIQAYQNTTGLVDVAPAAATAASTARSAEEALRRSSKAAPAAKTAKPKAAPKAIAAKELEQKVDEALSKILDEAEESADEAKK